MKEHKEWVDKYKVLIPRSWGAGDAMHDKLNPIIAEPGSVSTETYVVVGPVETLAEAENIISYINTKFFHALVSMMKISQQAPQKIYEFVPIQNFDEPWNDYKLYKKYGLTNDEISFIETFIWPEE